MRIAVFSLTVCIAVGISGTAVCQQDDGAKAAFEEGSEHFNAGRFEEAAVAFRKAHQLRPNWKLLYNIGQSEAAAKRHGLALQAFEEYLAEGGDDLKADRIAEVGAEIKRLREIVGELEVKAPDGSVVYVDGRKRGTTPLPGPMPVGAGKVHNLRVQLPSGEFVAREVRVGGGRSVTVDVSREEPEGPAPVTGSPVDDTQTQDPAAEDPQPLTGAGETDDGPDRYRKLRIAGIVIAGVGGAVLIGGAAAGGAALKIDGTLKDNCPNGECGPDYYDDVDKMGNLAVASDVMVGVGAAALAAGAVMVVISYVRGESSGEGAVAVSPLAGTGFAGLSMQGRF